METVYIVVGDTGEYSDRTEWFVAAYADEAMARAHAEAAKRWYQENDVYEQRYDREWRGANPFDPHMQTYYTGTDWTVAVVPFLTALPAPTIGTRRAETSEAQAPGEA